ncbi:MAG: flavin reductase family protein [Bacillota bacterium]
MKIEVPVEAAYRLINPGCVVLVTSAYRDRSNVMTLAWQTPLSSRPPLVGIAVAQKHLTAELITAGGEFALNIPGANLLKQVLRCGKVSGRERDKFKEAGLTPVAAKKIRAPLIAECLGHLECGVVDRYKTGDHYFFVGEVLAAGAQTDFFSERWNEAAELIHHLGGKWFYRSGRREET